MEDTNFSIFEKWLKDNGAKIGNILMKNKINFFITRRKNQNKR